MKGNRVQSTVRWAVVATLLAGAGCGSDHASQVPEEPTPPPCLDCGGGGLVGAATIFVDTTSIPADGTTLTAAHATFTDRRGISLVGVPVRFTATIADVTWVDPASADPESSHLTECDEPTGSDGTAECVFRAGSTVGKAFITAAAPESVGLSASEQIELVH